MDNNVILTDNELSVIQTSLQLSISGIEQYIGKHGADSIDYHTGEALEEMKELFNKLNEIYF